MNKLEFEWDPRKAAANLLRHGISFEDAATVFGDPLALTVSDPGHSEQEHRYITMGETALGKIAVVIHTDREDVIRIISARAATRKEHHDYTEK